MRAAEFQIGKQSHLQFAASGKVFKIETMRRNQQLCTEKSSLLAAKSPDYVGLWRFNPFQIHPVWQKNGEPRLGGHRFRICLANLASVWNHRRPPQDLSPRIIELFKQSPGAYLRVLFRQFEGWLKKGFGGD